jgi:hypothetical protein
MSLGTKAITSFFVGDDVEDDEPPLLLLPPHPVISSSNTTQNEEISANFLEECIIATISFSFVSRVLWELNLQDSIRQGPV